MLGALRKTGGVARRAARGAAALAGQPKRAMSGVMDEYGSMCFVGAVADKVSSMCSVVRNGIPAPHAARLADLTRGFGRAVPQEARNVCC